MKKTLVQFFAIMLYIFIFLINHVYAVNSQWNIGQDWIFSERNDFKLEELKKIISDNSIEQYALPNNDTVQLVKVNILRDIENYSYTIQGPDNLNFAYGSNIEWEKDEKSKEVWLEVQYKRNLSEEEAYTIYLNTAYDKSLDPEKEGWQAERMMNEAAENIGNAVNNVANGINNVIDGIKTVDELRKEFSKDPMSALERWALKLLRTIFDWIQTLLNLMVNLDDGINFKDFKLMYSKSDLESAEINKYTKVGDANSNKAEWQSEIPIKNQVEQFTEETNIPVITVDFYTIARGDIDFFDINFLNPDESKHGKIWTLFKDIAVNFMHIAIYIAAAFLLTSLIIFGIRIVHNSMNLKILDDIFEQKNPQEVLNYKESIKRYAISFSMLILMVLFISVCVYLNEYAVNTLAIRDTGNKDSFELPIKVKVDGVYSFSTNPIGYFRYMALSQESSDQKHYTYAYIILVVMNVILVVIMTFRVFMIYYLNILGPILLVAYATNLEEHMPIDISSWAIKYLKISTIPIIMALTYKLIEQIAIFEK